MHSNTTPIYFGTSDFQTADEISKRLGDQTIIIEDTSVSSQSGSSSGGRETTHSYSRSTSANAKHHGRRLLKPEEILTLPQRTAITFVAGMPPIITTLIRHYEEGWLTKKGRPMWMTDVARFTRALVACGAFLWIDVILTPPMIRALHVLMGH